MKVTKSRIVRFVSLTAWDAVCDLVLPRVIVVGIQIGKNVHECFLAADPVTRQEISESAADLDDAEVGQAAEEIASEWEERSGRELPGPVREATRSVILALRDVGRNKARSEPSELLLRSLNRRLAAGDGNQIRAASLTPDQRGIGRLWASYLLSPHQADDVSGRAQGVLPRIPNYEVVRTIGSGGFSQVYSARHLPTNSIRAIKIGQLGDPKRLNREITTIRDISHPHLVRYFEHGELEDRYWIAMEYLGECALADILSGPQTRPDLEQALLLGQQILDGLDALHRNGFIHRDLKPQNIMLDADFQIRLIDFGLSKPFHSIAGSTTSLTGAGDLVGTPQYMSPEQVRGEPRLTPATDLWSYGLLMIELLTGNTVFQATTIMALGAEILTRPIDLNAPSIPEPLRPILAKCLMRNSSERYANASALESDFLPISAKLRQMARHERYRGSWIEIVEKGILERFASDSFGKGTTLDPAAFREFAFQQGVVDVDDERSGKILPLVSEAQKNVGMASRKVNDAKVKLQTVVVTLNTQQMAERLNEIKSLEEAEWAAKAQLTQVIKAQLAEELRTWQELEEQRAETQRRQEEAKEAEIRRVQAGKEAEAHRERIEREKSERQIIVQALSEARAQKRAGAVIGGGILGLVGGAMVGGIVGQVPGLGPFAVIIAAISINVKIYKSYN